VLESETPLSRRTLLKGAAVAAGTAAATGALPGLAQASTRHADTTTVTFWDNYVTQAPWVNNEIRIFEAANPGITIRRTTQISTSYPNLFALAIKSGNEPDTFVIPFTPALNAQVANGWLAPLDKYAGPSFKSRFPAGTFHEGSNMFGAKLYSAPLAGNAPILLLYIHNGVFRQAGLTNPDGSVRVPRTWQEMTAAAAAIAKKSGGSTYGFGFGNQATVFLGFWIDLLCRGAGAPAGLLQIGGIDYRVGKSTFSTNPAYLQAINLMLDWKSKGHVYPNAMSIGDETARAFFERGKFGMLGDGIWCEAEWTSHGFTDYSVTTLPSPTMQPRAYYYYTPGGFQFGLSPTAKNPAAAFKWLDHLYSVEAGKRYVEMGNDLSAFPQNNKAKSISFKPFAEYVATAKDALPGPDPTIRNPAAANVIQAPVTPNIFQIISGAYTGQITDVKGALVTLDAAQNKALAAGIAAAQAKGFKVSINDFIFSDWNPTKPYITKPR